MIASSSTSAADNAARDPVRSPVQSSSPAAGSIGGSIGGSISGLAAALWGEVREIFAARYGTGVADLWFKNLRPLAFRRGTVWLGAPNSFVKEFVAHRYGPVFEQILCQLTGSPVTVRVVLSDYLRRALPEDRCRPTAREPIDFVVRPENRTAFGAFSRSLREPVALFNPLFVYGKSGTGKTALLRWYLRHAGDQGRLLHVSQLSGESFMRGFTRAVRCGQIGQFRGDILCKEVLVLDEAHRLAERPVTQRAFLSILCHFLERGRQVILLSRHHPREILHLDPALCSYFLSGLVTSLADPSVPSRIAVLETHASRFRRPVERDAIEVIAGNVPGSLREEISVLKRAAALAALRGERLTGSFVTEHFSEVHSCAVPEEMLGRLLERVCELLDVDRNDVIDGRKTRRASLARHVTIYLASTNFGFSARRIGRALGTLSPSVVPYARQRVDRLRREDPEIDALLARVRGEVGGQQYLF